MFTCKCFLELEKNNDIKVDTMCHTLSLDKNMSTLCFPRHWQSLTVTVLPANNLQNLMYKKVSQAILLPHLIPRNVVYDWNLMNSKIMS